LSPAIPEYGSPAPGVNYVLRPGGYAVIFDAAGRVAVVAAPGGLYLPGGGQDPEESPVDAAIREAREEGGLVVAVGRCLGVADELVFADAERTHYRKRCTFFLADVVGRADATEPDHALHWMPVEEAVRRLRDGSQRWAVAEACRLAGAEGS
jgi:8-oxo-dGTP diphosphatase